MGQEGMGTWSHGGEGVGGYEDMEPRWDGVMEVGQMLLDMEPRCRGGEGRCSRPGGYGCMEPWGLDWGLTQVSKVWHRSCPLLVDWLAPVVSPVIFGLHPWLLPPAWQGKGWWLPGTGAGIE